MAAYRRRALAVACARRPPWDVLRPEAAICVVGLPKTYRVMTRVCGGMHHAGVHMYRATESDCIGGDAELEAWGRWYLRTAQ